MDRICAKIRALLQSKDFGSVQQGVEFLSSYTEDFFWMVWGPLRSIEDLERALLDYHHTGYLKIWTIGMLHAYRPEWFEPIRTLEIKSIPFLEVIPEEIVQCSELRELVIDGGKMTVLPSFINKLSKLERLTIGKTPLALFPKEICSGPLARSLKELHFQECPFTDIPDEIAGLTHLIVLGFSEVHLKNISPMISQCTSLEDFSMYFYRKYYWRRQIVSFVLPKSILVIPNLKSLSLSNIDMRNEAEFLGAYLKKSCVVDNRVCFPFSFSWKDEHLQQALYRQLIANYELSIIPYIRTLDLSRLSFSFEHLRYFSRLETLTIQHSELCTLPDDFWQMFPKLKHLDVSHNRLTKLPAGAIPEQLETLVVHHNQLSFIAGHRALIVNGVLNLSYNRFSLFPKNMPLLDTAVEVNIAYNQYDRVPLMLASCVSLKRLYMESNQLHDLPIFLKDFSLEEFRVQKNKIVQIPEELYSLIKRPVFSKSVFTEQKGFVWPYRAKSQIHRVRMRKFFADAKPEDCKGMYTLDVSGLGWDALPEIICQITTIHHLNLSGNRLSTLPKEMEQLTNLMTLNIRDNHLKELPTSLGTMKRLQKVFAGGNKISEFPSFLLHCTKLVQLNLSSNLLTNIPATIWSFPSLSICVLKDNQILDFPDPLDPISQQWENINLKGNPIKKHFDIPFIRM